MKSRKAPKSPRAGPSAAPRRRKAKAAPSPDNPVAKTRPRTTEPAEPVAWEGGCHCGALEYTFITAVPVRRWAISACSCGFCRGHGARLVSDPAGHVRFRFVHPQYLRRYRFALRTADFVICKECGTCIGAVLLSGRGAQAAINVNTLFDPPADLPAGKPVSYEGESTEARRSRRIEQWTPVTGPV